jgi:hypothetical protein
MAEHCRDDVGVVDLFSLYTSGSQENEQESCDGLIVAHDFEFSFEAANGLCECVKGPATAESRRGAFAEARYSRKTWRLVQNVIPSRS